jgi:predicted nucleotidyltransferase component of viral defense system
MELPSLTKFSLVGGTALSLKYGHRKSIDLDLFSIESFDNEIVLNEIRDFYKSDFIIEGKPAKFGIFGFIKDIKIDIVHYPHSNIRPLYVADGVRMFSDEDIMAMKVKATLGRGKKKDFWDIAELLEYYTVEDFVKFHKEKYDTQNLLITVPQAISYFADAEESEDPISLKGQTWENIKASIQEKVSAYLI